VAMSPEPKSSFAQSTLYVEELGLGGVFGGRAIVARLLTIDGVQDQFDATGEAELIEDPEEIILYRMLAKSKALGYLAIRQTLGQQGNDLFLALRQDLHSLGINDAKRRNISESFQGVLEFVTGCPNLPAMNTTNGLAQCLERIGSKEHALSTTAKGIYDLLAVALIEQHDWPGTWKTIMYQAKCPKPGHGAVCQIGAYKRHRRRVKFNLLDDLLRMCDLSLDLYFLTRLAQGVTQQLSRHAVGVGDHQSSHWPR
jgi:hypothetical protein